MATKPKTGKAAGANRSVPGGDLPSWIPPPMASNPAPQDNDDTAYLVVIVLLVVLLLGLAPIVVDMYLETKTALAELKDEKKSLQKLRRQMEQQQRKGNQDD